MSSQVKQRRLSNPALAIAVGGVLAGALDLTQAMILFGKTIPLAIAAGLLGPRAFQGGAGIYPGSVAALSHRLLRCGHLLRGQPQAEILTEYPVACGLFFGAAVELVMTLVVLPLSALHATGPYTYRDIASGFLVHMVLVGLPISFSMWWFARQPE